MVKYKLSFIRARYTSISLANALQLWTILLQYFDNFDHFPLFLFAYPIVDIEIHKNPLFSNLCSAVDFV